MLLLWSASTYYNCKTGQFRTRSSNCLHALDVSLIWPSLLELDISKPWSCLNSMSTLFFFLLKFPRPLKLCLRPCPYLPTTRKSQATWYLSHTWDWKVHNEAFLVKVHRSQARIQVCRRCNSGDCSLCSDQQSWCDAHLHPTTVQCKIQK